MEKRVGGTNPKHANYLNTFAFAQEKFSLMVELTKMEKTYEKH